VTTRSNKPAQFETFSTLFHVEQLMQAPELVSRGATDQLSQVANRHEAAMERRDLFDL
jgi:hypothetical protein